MVIDDQDVADGNYMAEKYQTVSNFSEYNTSFDRTNAPKDILVAGSQNVMIDARNGKVRSRPGYTRLGVANTALTPVRNSFSWLTSKGGTFPIRHYDDELEVYLGTVDGTITNAWTRIKDAWSTTAILRFATFYDVTEGIDLLIFVQADANMYEWSGAVAIVSSVTAVTVTKAGTNTFAQSRFYTTRNKTFVCVRTGTEYTYTGGESTLTLTGIADTTGLIAGDILVQKVITRSSLTGVPSGRKNYTIFNFENQILIGSEEDENVYISKNGGTAASATNYYDFGYTAAGRIAGEGGVLTLTDPVRGFGNIANNCVVFCGRSSAFKLVYQPVTVSSGATQLESLTALPLKIGVDQGAVNQETIVPVGTGIIYLTNEPTVRMLESIVQADQPQLKSLSNPVKSDFDAEDWTNACALWFKNAFWLSNPVGSRAYILEFVEDANGRLRRFWQPPQILPVRSFSIINDDLIGHSSLVPESYTLLDGLSDTASDDSKLPINAKAYFAYWNYGSRATLKDFDEIYAEGEITSPTNDLLLSLNYDYSGHAQQIEKTIDGTDEDILEEVIPSSSLAQESLGVDNIAGLLNPPADAKKYRIIFEIAKEDFHEMQAFLSTNEADRYWSILALGINARLSPRKPNVIKK